MIIPVYQSEIAHPSIRGRVTALQQFMLGIGAFVAGECNLVLSKPAVLHLLIAPPAGWLSYGTFHLSGSGQWRIPLGIQIVPAVILAVLILVFPESPRWLIDHGREEHGLKTLAILHADGNVNDDWVRAEYAQIQESITYEHEHEAKSYTELLRSRYGCPARDLGGGGRNGPC